MRNILGVLLSVFFVACGPAAELEDGATSMSQSLEVPQHTSNNYGVYTIDRDIFWRGGWVHFVGWRNDDRSFPAVDGWHQMTASLSATGPEAREYGAAAYVFLPQPGGWVGAQGPTEAQLADPNIAYLHPPYFAVRYQLLADGVPVGSFAIDLRFARPDISAGNFNTLLLPAPRDCWSIDACRCRLNGSC